MSDAAAALDWALSPLLRTGRPDVAAMFDPSFAAAAESPLGGQ